MTHERANGGVGDHDLHGQGAAAARRCRDQLLAQHALECEGELRPDLLLLSGREHINDTVDGLDGVARVQGAEREVARLGNRESRLDGLHVTHLTNKYDVRILTQRAAQRRGEVLGVRADLALIEETALVPVQELDRILDR